MQPNWLSVLKSGVMTGSEKSVGIGRSTIRPRSSNIFEKLSKSSFPLSIVSWGLFPQFPRISLSSGTLPSRAGSGGGI